MLISLFTRGRSSAQLVVLQHRSRLVCLKKLDWQGTTAQPFSLRGSNRFHRIKRTLRTLAASGREIFLPTVENSPHVGFEPVGCRRSASINWSSILWQLVYLRYIYACFIINKPLDFGSNSANPAHATCPAWVKAISDSTPVFYGTRWLLFHSSLLTSCIYTQIEIIVCC